ncbi:MAG: hypothetical protein IMW94_05935 [Thermoanaerobacter sp.]|nr:hypothetical protein [Thermoanaerobacter sp.]MBE3585687.1 hypothetical protein [Thermoanaerobacter sp.]
MKQAAMTGWIKEWLNELGIEPMKKAITAHPQVEDFQWEFCRGIPASRMSAS